ncbi:transcription termination/antitermination protein NusG [Novosphingobium jiangmenense]|uniref:Transcriptional activator RfaH n=1 Tax=Novosphingobium jiangmenense TaxID=2791981 RepID=A0ABS0HCF9_9SPHN|nr:transcriptional activator RfaH [Novosphingobium jiangmenense]MBF9149690.1 transcriptional activator RfaH [Novosphingobium jiangmenense]
MLVPASTTAGPEGRAPDFCVRDTKASPFREGPAGNSGSAVSSPASWYVVETLPRLEHCAQDNLLRQGFTCFLPKMRKLRKHARRVDEVLVPLFPGYAFVQFNPELQAWRSINGTRGVRRIVGPDSAKPQAVPRAAMQALFDRCVDGIVGPSQASLSPGMPVRLVSHAFADHLATVEHLDEKGRVSVLLDILGRATRLRVSTRNISPEPVL